MGSVIASQVSRIMQVPGVQGINALNTSTIQVLIHCHMQVGVGWQHVIKAPSHVLVLMHFMLLVVGGGSGVSKDELGLRL